jgi:hypothetical protein
MHQNKTILLKLFPVSAHDASGTSNWCDQQPFRLRKVCVYIEDTVQTHFADDHSQSDLSFDVDPSNNNDIQDGQQHTLDLSYGVDPPNRNVLQHCQQHTLERMTKAFRSHENISIISEQFFTGTHQRLSAVSKLKFKQNLQSLNVDPQADFMTLCLSILLIEHMPTEKDANMQSALYFEVKSLLTMLEAAGELSLDLVNCRVLLTFYEMGHGLHRAAYISIAACARAARLLGLHKKKWCRPGAISDRLTAEEEKRTWWAIVLMDRFISLCNGDALLVTEDPERTDPLPIEDLLWSESSDQLDLENLTNNAPLLSTPFSITVGQMARECQIASLAGHVVRHVFGPLTDPSFDIERAMQLERTLKSYIPLLSNEELSIGKYCGAFGMCNRYAVLLLLPNRESHVLYILTPTAHSSFSTNTCYAKMQRTISTDLVCFVPLKRRRYVLLPSPRHHITTEKGTTLQVHFHRTCLILCVKRQPCFTDFGHRLVIQYTSSVWKSSNRYFRRLQRDGR